MVDSRCVCIVLSPSTQYWEIINVDNVDQNDAKLFITNKVKLRYNTFPPGFTKRSGFFGGE